MQKIKYIVLSTLFLSLGMFTSCNKTTTDVMIVGVNEEGWNEISVLVDNLKNCNKKIINYINFYTGRIDNKNVVVAEAPIGTSEAAMVTTIGIEHFSPKYVITEGTCGGHHVNLTYYDIVLGKDVLNVASYKGEPLNPEELQHPTLNSDPVLLSKAKKAKKPIEGIQIKDDGVIASSDCWNTNKEYVETLQKIYHEDCEEMESYAVLNVCAFYETPALAIRMISNNLTRDEPYEKNKEVAKQCQLYTIDVVKTI